MEDSKHKLTRNLLAPAFSPQALLEWKALVAPVARDAITTLAERKRADLIADLLLPLPVRMLYEITGFPQDVARTQEFDARDMPLLEIGRANARTHINHPYLVCRLMT